MMYVPAHFTAPPELVEQVLADLRAVDLVTPTAEGLLASVVPMIYDRDRQALFGHLARPNEHWQCTPTGDSLALVRRTEGYVSPNWYAAKAEHGRVVPTWDYLSVQVHGALVVHDDETWKREHVRQLTDLHEGALPQPWSIDDAPGAFVAGQLRAVVGIEVRISRIEAKAKLSQNRPDGDLAQLVAGLRAAGSPDVAEAVAHARRSPDHVIAT